MREPAPAKVNVFLRVLGRRDDGFHDVESLLQPITLADGVQASPAPTLELQLAGPAAEGVPPGDENLVLQAARALAEEAGVGVGARLLVAKNVPAAGGLGGGSADAAAALRALNRMWGLGWTLERLAAVGAEVGSDVPALVVGGAVLARGRGERVEQVPAARTWWVLVTFPFGVRAEDAYRWWDEDAGATGPEPDRLLRALRGGRASDIGPLLYNDLESGVVARHPEVEEARGRLLDAGAEGAIMSGSGPSVIGLCRDGRHAEDLAARVGGLVVGSITRPLAG